MKIEIRNFGPICKYECDLDKSLIVIYGENNIGKSYAMQVTYLLLKKIKMYAEYPAFMGRFYLELEENHDEIEKLVKEFVLDQKSQVWDITDKVISAYKKILEELLLKEFCTSLENTFGTYDKLLEQNPVIKLQINKDEEYIFLPNENQMDINIKIKKIFLRKTESNFHKSRNNKEHYDVYVYENYINTPVNLVGEKISEMSRDFARKILAWMRDVYFLPASRSGIYTGMSSFGPIMAQLSQNRAYFTRSFQIPSIPEPISDYYMALSNIKNDRSAKFSDVAYEIEEDVLKGEVKFDVRKKALTYQGKTIEHSFEMNDVSSMVSEISPIVAYLKYIVKQGNAGISLHFLLLEMIDASILLYSNYGGVLMRSKRIPAEEQYRLIMECRQSGLTDHQWCVEHDIKPGTFYNWVKRLRQKGCVDLPASTGRTYRAPESQEVVRVDFHDTDPIPYEQPLNVIPAATERNNLSVAEPMKLSVGSFHLTIPNGTDPQLLAQTLRIVKELGC